MKKLLFILTATVCIANAVSSVEPVKDVQQGWVNYCESLQSDTMTSKVVTLVPEYDDGSSGLPKQFCQVTSESNLKVFGLDALASNKPTLAATYAQVLKLTELQVNTMDYKAAGYANAAQYVCAQSGGAEVEFVTMGSYQDTDSAATDVCTFGDGSSISGWTLLYLAIGAFPEVREAIKSKPISNVKMPRFEYKN